MPVSRPQPGRGQFSAAGRFVPKVKPGAERASVPRAGASFALTVILLIGGGLLVIDFRLFMFFVVGMSPTIVAFVVDADRRKYAARSVGCLNFAGLSPYFGKLIDGSHGTSAVIDLASDMTAWLIVGGAAAGGWLLHFCMPMLVGQVMRLIDRARVGALRLRQRELAKEWGEEIRSGAADGKSSPPRR